MQLLKKIIHYSLYSLIFLLPWQTRWIYNPATLNGSNWEYGTQSLYATQFILAIILIFAIIYFSQNLKGLKKEKLGWQSPIWKLLLIIGLLAITIVNAINPELAFYKFTHLISAGALFLVIITIKPKINYLIGAFLSAGLIQSILAIYQFITQKVFASKFLGMASQSPDILGVPVIENNGERILRAFGSLPHPNILAGLLVFCTLLTITFVFYQKKYHKILYFSFFLNCLALLTTASRSGIIALTIAIIFLYLFKKTNFNYQNLHRFTLIFITVIILFSILLPGALSQRFNSNNRLTQSSNNERIGSYVMATRVFLQYPITGTGLGNYTLGLFKLNSSRPGYEYQPLHNAWLLPLIETGIIGLITIIIFFIGIFNTLKEFWQKKESTQTFPFIIAIIIAMGIINLFDHYLYSFYFGLMLSAIVLGIVFSLLQTGEKNESIRKNITTIGA